MGKRNCPHLKFDRGYHCDNFYHHNGHCDLLKERQFCLFVLSKYNSIAGSKLGKILEELFWEVQRPKLCSF